MWVFCFHDKITLMENLKPFLATITKTDTATTVAASVMMTVCTLAMFLTWGMLAAAAMMPYPRSADHVVIKPDVSAEYQVR